MSAPMNQTDLRAEADDDLLIRYQELDDQAAFAELDRRYHSRLVAHLRRKGGPLRAYAEEIVQEAFLTFHKNRKSYARKNAVGALLYKIVSNCSKRHLETVGAKKRDHRRTRPLLPSDADAKADPARQQEKIDAETKVKKLLDSLTPVQAEAVRLTKIEGHSAESAAAILGTTPRAASERVTRAMTALKQKATTTLILFALVGAVANDCDFDGCMNMVAAANDEDEVAPEDNESHPSTKLCRKSLMEADPMTCVVNARHKDYDVLIARPSKWGKPCNFDFRAIPPNQPPRR